VTVGRRVRSEYALPHRLQPGEYGRHVHDQHWIGRTPNGHLCNLSRHEVVEHEDETITVSPSIAVSKSRDEVVWHGFLERGVWREVP
jgi:hypothetical protein